MLALVGTPADGEFEDADATIEVCRALYAKNCRVCAFGVGDSASEAQMKGLAQAGELFIRGDKRRV